MQRQPNNNNDVFRVIWWSATARSQDLSVVGSRAVSLVPVNDGSGFRTVSITPS